MKSRNIKGLTLSDSGQMEQYDTKVDYQADLLTEIGFGHLLDDFKTTDDALTQFIEVDFFEQLGYEQQKKLLRFLIEK